MEDEEWLNKKICKLNHLEIRGIWAERFYYFGPNSTWHIGRIILEKNGRKATSQDISEFRKLMEKLMEVK